MIDHDSVKPAEDDHGVDGTGVMLAFLITVASIVGAIVVWVL